MPNPTPDSYFTPTPTAESLASWSEAEKDAAILRLVKTQENLLQELEQTRRAMRSGESSLLRNSLAVVITQTWKLRARLWDCEAGQVHAGMQRLFRHVEVLQDTCHQLGLRVHDPTGEPFDFGLPLTVITSQPVPGTVREYVLETIKPTVYWNQQLIQAGEVVIATPSNPPPLTRSLS